MQRTSATRPSTCAQARPQASSPSQSAGATSTRASASRPSSPTCSWRRPESCLASSDVTTRLEELREQLKRWGYAYHVLDDPEVPDTVYDQAFDELLELERELPEDEIPLDSPTRRVGAPPSDRFRKVEHLQPMGSLDKLTTD